MGLDEVEARAAARQAALGPDPVVEVDLAQLDGSAATAAMLPEPFVAAEGDPEWLGPEFDWSADGAYDRCVAAGEGNIDDPQSFCAENVRAATGEWPPGAGRAVPVALPDGQRASAFIPNP